MLVFNNPWYLLLLAVLPVMWWFSFGSLSGLGRWRRHCRNGVACNCAYGVRAGALA